MNARTCRKVKAQTDFVANEDVKRAVYVWNMNSTKAIALCLALAVSAFAQSKPRNSDIENIGSRDINKGTINFYTLDKEIAMGRQLSAEYERNVRLYDNADVNEYVNRLGQNILHNSDAVNIPVTFKIVEATDLD